MAILANFGILLLILSGGYLGGKKVMQYIEDDSDKKKDHLYFAIGIFVFHLALIVALTLI